MIESCFGKVATIKFKKGKIPFKTELVDVEFQGEMWTGDINSEVGNI